MKAERVKIGYGADAVLQDVTTDAPLPVTITGLLASLASVLAAVDGLEGKDYATQATLSALLTSANVAATADVAVTLTDGRKTVTAAGTAEAIRSSLACRWVTITALKTNLAQVNVGGSGVLATVGASTGTPLDAGAGLTLPVDNAAKVFVDARTSGEGVSFTVGS